MINPPKYFSIKMLLGHLEIGDIYNHLDQLVNCNSASPPTSHIKGKNDTSSVLGNSNFTTDYSQLKNAATHRKSFRNKHTLELDLLIPYTLVKLKKKVIISLMIEFKQLQLYFPIAV